MKQLILHIGTVKTGTTAIQRFLYMNRDLLDAEGIGILVQQSSYQRRDGRLIGNARNGHFLIPLVLAKTSFPASIPPGNLRRANSDAEAFKTVISRRDTAVLSDEDLGLWASRRTGFWLSLRDVVTNLGVERTTFVVYLRRQDKLASSWWLQRVKARNYAEGFEQYLNSPTVAAYLDYNAWISELESVFGVANVTVRRYDRSLFPGGDVCRDFCETTGIPWNESFELPVVANPSLSMDVAEVKRLFNTLSVYGGSNNFLETAALRVSKTMPDPPGMSRFSPEEASALLAHHAEGNRAIAERHFGGEPLFDENVNGLVKWERNEARMRETAAALFADPGTLATAVLLFAEELDAERNRRQGFGKWVHYAGLIKKMLASILLKLKRIAPTLLTRTGLGER